MDVDAFIENWGRADLSERAHAHTFMLQLCRILGVAAPDEDRPGDPDYGFERSVRVEEGIYKTRHIDCYKRGCFVMEAKQSDTRRRAPVRGTGTEAGPHLGSASSVERTMREALRQAEGYARALDEWPPFLIVIDVGRSIELWSDFSRLGKAYSPFPNAVDHRIPLADLARPDVRRMLATIWTDPMSLDPAGRSAAVTTEISAMLSGVVRSICARRSDADPVHREAWTTKATTMVMHCILAMFADSVGLIRDHGFRRFLEDYRGQAHVFHLAVSDVFQAMERGGHSAALRQTVPRCSGGLFRAGDPMPITESELDVLIEASRRDWANVEPSIFGAMLEGALDTGRRGALGAHFTPRAYVEILVQATVMDPLRADWHAAESLALEARRRGEPDTALGLVRDFHRSLRSVRVLDPACGTGNFLYVALDMMKTLESEVLSLLGEVGDGRGHSERRLVGPGQFRGIEKNPGAAAIAELVLWIGHLQWHLRNAEATAARIEAPRNVNAIQVMDALLCCRLDVAARDLTRIEPRRPRWPDADFIVGNPPFMGAKDQRLELGQAYVDALWATRQGRFRSADLATCWWDRAAGILTRHGSRLRRFGFITTNSITQPFSRRVLEHHLGGPVPMRLAFAIPDHPWVGSSGGAAASVRVAMTIAELGAADGHGRVLSVIETGPSDDAPRLRYVERRGHISADLTVGVSPSDATPLRANAGLASRGVQLMGAGFIVDAATAERLNRENAAGAPSPFRPYRNGRDLTDRPREVQVIDLPDREEEEIRKLWPGVHRHLLETMKPDRDRNNRAAYRRRWWMFGEPRPALRAALSGLDRYIVTVEISKHRWFRFLPAEVLADNRLVCIASSDPFLLAVLSSRVHTAWARASGGLLEDRPIYAKSACFDRFPFPEVTPVERDELGRLAEALDRLRQEVLARLPRLTMTGLYNARDRRRQGRTLTGAEAEIDRDGRVALLNRLHERIDEAVLSAYGWPVDIGDAAVVGRLIALNGERAALEKTGDVRYLRPDMQIDRTRADRAGPGKPRRRPADRVMSGLPDGDGPMASVVLDRLRRIGRPMQPRALAEGFSSISMIRTARRIDRVLSVLAVAGSVHRTDSGWFAPDRPN